MIGRLSSFKWTEKSAHSRDLIFIIMILSIGIMLVARLAPYFQDKRRNVVFSSVTFPNTPKEVVERINAPMAMGNASSETHGHALRVWQAEKSNRPNLHVASVIERPVFDGRTVILKVRSLNPFSSKESGQTLEVGVLSPLMRETDSDIDFSIVEGAKVIGTGSANFSTKRLLLNFSELITREGRSYQVNGQAIDPTTLTAGIEADYSSGLTLRLLGLATNRAILAADQVAMAEVFSSVESKGAASEEFQKAAIETNQQASQNLAAEATKDLRETPAEIVLHAGSEFFIRVRSNTGGITP